MPALIQLASGGYLDLLDPQPEDIHIEDIAHGLSNICRFGGHTKEFLSVAQHSVFCSELVEPELAIVGLLHDASESFLGDSISPLKALLPDYRKIEQQLERVIADRFGYRFEQIALVKPVDLIALITEKRDFCKAHPDDAIHWAAYAHIKPHTARLHSQSPEVARACFLRRYKRIQLQAGHVRELCTN